MRKTLIVSEKNIAARRLAQLLGGSYKTEKVGSVEIYNFKLNGRQCTAIGLKGHILKVDFPLAYANWQEVDPAELINAQIIKVPTQKGIINTLKKQAKDADEVIIATDFDREGELIGVDAVNQIREVKDLPVKRARFSALTKEEIDKAFNQLESVYFNLAQAGEARQDIDLIWGATLTRFLSLASTRLGKNFLSVGRVQSPTLWLIVEREKEREAFTPQTYWQLKVVFEHSGQTYEASHKTERFWDKGEVEEILSKLGETGEVSSVKTTKRTLEPPAPFNTTAFLAAASALGLSPAKSMSIAESLYMNGYISYPRVDNTVYPDSLAFKEILAAVSAADEIGVLAQEVAGQKELKPTRGKKKTTDHPPIHPTGAAKKEKLSAQEWKVYELVVRRFLATLAPPAQIESKRIDISVNNEPFFLRGSVVKQAGWLKYYPYSQRKDELVPDLAKGDIVKIVEPKVEEKQTQPPARYSQGTLIQKMEEAGLGTKATRHAIIQNLYDRGYIHSDPIIPTELGIAVAEALKKHAQKIASPEMTAELEGEMDLIAEGRKSREEVVERSRQLLTQVMLTLKEKKEQVAEEIKGGILTDKIVGQCPKCGSNLRIIRAKKSKKRFVGCTNYPDCQVTYPLPQFGDVISTGEVCEPCGSPKVKIISKGKRPWELCLDPKCSTKEGWGTSKQAKQ